MAFGAQRRCDWTVVDRDIFVPCVHSETRVAMDPWFTRNYKSTQSHVIIRVSAGGSSYMVDAFNDRNIQREVVTQFGRYRLRYSEAIEAARPTPKKFRRRLRLGIGVPFPVRSHYLCRSGV